MGQPDIPAAKRAGLPVDLERLTAEGDDWLSPEERYALKTHGVCAQAQPHVFMVRIRTTDGVVGAKAAHDLADVADIYGRGWIHLTTRQQVELHHVRAREVTAVLAAVERAGLTTRATCGHAVRGVMACPYAGAGLDEPFDCRPDARAVSALVTRRSQDLNRRLPSRLNISFGGCPSCRDHAKVNDLGFVSRINAEGVPGYELWIGGSLGKSAPTLGVRVREFLDRREVLAVIDALLGVYCQFGDVDRPGRARLKFLIRELGLNDFLALFDTAFSAARQQPWPEPSPVEVTDARATDVLATLPPGGWSTGVRPQRAPGYALVTVNVPLGDLDSEDLGALADLSEELAGGNLHLSHNQNVVLQDVPVAQVPTVRARLAALGLGLEGADSAIDVRACTGGPVCSLAITPAQTAATRLLPSPALSRNSGLRVHVSGCMNACAQHQIADLGFSGAKVTVAGRSTTGYQVWLGGDLGASTLGQVIGRVADDDVAEVTEAVVGAWEALREHGETLAATAARIGPDAFSAHLRAVLAHRWEPGPEPSAESVA